LDFVTSQKNISQSIRPPNEERKSIEKLLILSCQNKILTNVRSVNLFTLPLGGRQVKNLLFWDLNKSTKNLEGVFMFPQNYHIWDLETGRRRLPAFAGHEAQTRIPA